MSDTGASTEAAKIQAAIPGNPTDEELARTQAKQKVSRSGVVDGHKMNKRRHDGKDLFVCGACTYKTYREESARDHERRPK